MYMLHACIRFQIKELLIARDQSTTFNPTSSTVAAVATQATHAQVSLDLYYLPVVNI